MFEIFYKSYIALIKRCADEIYAVENGTANQRTVNELFNPSGFFCYDNSLNFPEFSWECTMNSAEDMRIAILEGDYTNLIYYLKCHYPDTDEAYLPFLVADLLRKFYGVKKNV